MSQIDIDTAAERINATDDFGAAVKGDRIEVTKFGKPAGHVTEDEIENIGHTPTGFGGNLRKGALEVWRAIRGE